MIPKRTTARVRLQNFLTLTCKLTTAADKHSRQSRLETLNIATQTHLISSQCRQSEE